MICVTTSERVRVRPTLLALAASRLAFSLLLATSLLSPLPAAAAPQRDAAHQEAQAAPQLDPQRARLSASSQNSLVLNERGVEALRAKNFAQATELFQKALASDPYNLSAVHNLASMFLLEKKMPQAEELLRRYVKENPKDAGLATRLGDVHFAAKNLPAARTAYENALAADPKRVETLLRLASVYTLEADRSKAEQLLQRVLVLQPKHYDALSSLAGLYIAGNAPQKAVSMAKRALQLKPSREVYLNLGSAYELLRDPKNALIAYERAKDLEIPGDALQAELTEKISVLREVLGKSTALAGK